MENKKYKIIGKIEIYDEEQPTGKFLRKGSIEEVPEELGSKWVENGLAILIEETNDTPLEDKDLGDDTENDKKIDAKVYNKDNQVVRVYSKEVHGKNFAKLAKEFANKKGYSLK